MQGVIRIQTPEGDRHVMAPIVETLLRRGLLFTDNYGVVNAPSLQELDTWVAEAGMCDFCSNPEAPHTLIVPDFRVKTTVTGDFGMSHGGWAACDECYDFIKANDRKGLTQRSIKLLAHGKYTAGALTELHRQFWVAYDAMSEAAGFAASLGDFVNGKLPLAESIKPEFTKREQRLEAIRVMGGFESDEVEALLRGELTYKAVVSKLIAWHKKFGKADIRTMAELREAQQRVPLPPGSIPHWQVALDRKFEALTGLMKAVEATSAVHLPEFTDLTNRKEIAAAVQRAQKIQTFRALGFAEDVKHLQVSEVYSFNADTMEAIRLGMQSIPHESPLSAVSMPQIPAGWFWFAEPYPIASSPIASQVTHALNWGWETGPGAHYLASRLTNTPYEGVPVLRFSAFVVDDTNHKIYPSTKWTWPLNMTFHDMLQVNYKAHEVLYGPGGEFEHTPELLGPAETLKCIAELSLFFLQACVWFKQRVVVPVDGHVERHARKRLQKEHKLKEPPQVKVIALRRSVRETDTTHTNGHTGERKYTKWRWVVDGHNRLQPCGPGRKDRKLIWIDAYPKGPENAPFKAKAQKVYAVIR